ncbi:DUF4296 domain-containing protein [Haoranjiania flava]|uniref:DUF4296 domain-containing protein n=1 Tax=Haoranjiania flava TaxID=1856322 RepID=A0AAE3LPT8_9BACT|nr:DUF4296 domain-containing protein [Haoranjiania flava]MCU7693825.1 DUF4296 domain-containing protein [Haoranjiania flava]
MSHNSFKHLAIFLCCTVLLIACSKVPRKYIQPEEMKELMWEMMFADKIAAEGGLVMPALTDTMSKEFSKVLKHHGVTQAKFVKSLEYYQSTPDIQKALYDSIFNYGSRMSEAVQARLRIKDSLRNAHIADSLESLEPAAKNVSYIQRTKRAFKLFTTNRFYQKSLYRKD